MVAHRKSNVRSNVQYTVRAVPPELDRKLRKRAKESGKSLNEVLLAAIHDGLGEKRVYHDLDFLFGTMSKKEARRIDREVAFQRRVDPEMWK